MVRSQRVVALTAALMVGGFASAETVSLIPPGAAWRYSDAGADLGTTWRAPAFNDAAWRSGPGQLGFGDFDEATSLTAGYVTYYFRHQFALANTSTISNLTARLVFDDGAVVYINGVEAFRAAMPPGPVTYTTLATGVVPDNSVQEASLSPGLLVNGTNVVAVEVHQANPSSTDLSFDLQLTGNTTPIPPSPGVFHFETPSTVSEGFPARTVVVRRSINTVGAASVEFFTRDQTATAGLDYVATNGVLQFANGESNKTFAVRILEDSLVESNETVLLVLTNAQGATLPGGGPMHTATLTIVDNDPSVAPPVIIQQPASQSAIAGQTVTFTVHATGTPPLRYQWQYDGTPIPGAINAWLTLDHLQIAQGGGYTVIVANAAGTVTSSKATLVVLPAPTTPGSLDVTFDPTRGGELIGPATESGEVVALARQPDGKLVIGGQFSGYNGSLRRHIARIHPNGALDEGFHPGLGVDGHVYAVALQPDGQMLVGGSFSVFDTQPCSSLVRLNSNGSLDTGFSAALARFGTPGSVKAIVVQGDGKILIGGSFSEANGVARTNVARLNPDGSLDAGFVPASGAPDWYQGVVSLTALPDGKLLVGGRFLGDRKLLCRLHPDGSLDSSFATELTGYELTQLGVRSDGKIYAAGTFDLDRPGWYYSRLVLLNADGTIDPDFTVDFGDVGFYCFAALTVQPDDRVLVSGWFQAVNSVPRDQVARLKPDGSLDESFDPGATLGEWYPTGDARSMVLEPDGHIWLGGVVPLADGSKVSLVRLQSNGQFDADFYAEAGEVNVAGDSISIQALAALPDGRVYVGGRFDAFNNQPRANLARLLPDGTLDHSFSPRWTDPGEVSILTLQPDGKLLAGSSSGLVRLNPDGNVDPTFIGPWGTIHGGEPWNMRMHCLALQADGKIIIGGEFEEGLARLNPDGSLDDTFHPPYLPAYDGDAVQALAVQPDGKILFGGNGAIGLQRLLPDGSVDPSFSFDGVLGHVIEHILVQADGSILIAGRSCLVIDDDPRGLARVQPDGRVDETFNAPIGDYVDAVAVAPDGRILATAPEGVCGWPSRIYRLDPDGRVDAAFQARLGLVYGPPVVADVLVQSDGQVLIGGTFTSVNGIPVDGLARLNNDLVILGPSITTTPASQTRLIGQTATFTVEATGTPPLSYQWLFNGQPLAGATNSALLLTNLQPAQAGGYAAIVSNPAGSVTSEGATLMVLPARSGPGAMDPAFAAQLPANSVVRGMARQADGKLVVVGWLSGSQDTPQSIARLHPDGRMDISFSATFDNAELFSVVIQPDGKILVAGGFSEVNGVERYGVARLHPDGSLDPTFQLGSPDNPWAAIRSLALQPDGKIIIGGLVEFGGHNVLLRLHPDGSVDESFNAGEVIIWEGDGYVVFNLALQPDGRILVHGEISRVQGHPVGGFFRLNANGSLDPTFHPAWQTEEDFYGGVTSLLLQPDGRIVVAGWIHMPDDSVAKLFRLNADGSLDAGFVPEVEGLGDCFALARQADGKIIVGGNYFDVPTVPPVRLNPDGRRDAQFDVGSGAEGNILRILIEPEGAILLGGYLTRYDGVPVPGLVRVQSGLAVPPSFVTRQITGLHVQLAAAPPTNVSVYAVEDQPPAGWEVTDLSPGGVFDVATGKVKFGPFYDHEPRTLSYRVVPPPGTEGIFTFSGSASADGVNTPIGGDQQMVLVSFHPAECRDVRPANWRLEMDEVTAYAAAWRRGLNWIVPPYVIPMDYVTRAAALWQGGECYTVDARVTNAPLWWVNCDAPPGAASPLAASPAVHLTAAQRQMPGGYVPGEPLTVTIATLPGADARAYAAEDTVPAGWAITHISHDGEWDAVSGKVRWGPFVDRIARTLCYQLTPPVAASGSVSIAGAASFDGVAVPISGARALSAGGRLTLVHDNSTGRLQVRLSGPAAARILIEVSDDLSRWTPLREVSNFAGSIEFSDADAANHPNRFYRVRVLD